MQKIEFQNSPLNYQNKRALDREKKVRHLWSLKEEPEKKSLLSRAGHPFFVKHLSSISLEAIEAALKVSGDIK